MHLIGASFAATETRGPVKNDSAKIEDPPPYVGHLKLVVKQSLTLMFKSRPNKTCGF